ncbi:serine hydrolase [Amycolatopsis acidicola]|uniref:Serine hydrolase n=1 Tax=Amycolatopsis acidicola TaxID=2596893 RepID=A0A5N0UM08_9PSEU|nr:serine hydrolase domain-containing protein [Amycolatopsis acidicola]KAA9151057.1 serine hydrolase [Amycolatopsis acidicola]
MSTDLRTQRRHNALGFCTKELCSALFVSGRSRAAAMADLDTICERFAGGALAPAEIEFTVDSASVTGRLPDGATRRAVADGIRGARLVTEGPGAGPAPRREPDPRPWPLGDAAAEKPGYDATRAAVREHLRATGARGVAVVHHGELVVEEFAPGFGPRTPTRGWSTAKTLTALIVDHLAGEGRLDPEAPAYRDITWLDLLRLRSGLAVRRFEDGSPEMLSDADDYFAMYVRPVSVERLVASARVEAAPGKLFCYKSIDHLTVALALRPVLGDDVHGQLTRTVLPALGLRHSVLETDTDGVPLLCGAWYTTPGDLARIGARVTDAMRSAPPVTEVAGPVAMRHPYGTSVWLDPDGHLGVDHPGICYALGSLGQAVFVVPGEGLVIARTALEPRSRHAGLLRAVLGALPRNP